MKIFSTWTDELDAFRRFFAGHEVNLLPENRKGLEIDLLLFPGGDDIHPKRYGAKLPQTSHYASWVDPERDEWEFSIIKEVFMGGLNPKKTLGVCRGMQFLNVAMSGSLVYDIPTRYGRPHSNYHDIKWQIETVFNSISVVNSMHHQGIYGLGDNLRPKILGIEPNSGLIEAVMWGNDFLGFQFHPELWGNTEEMKVFADGVIEWVEGKSIITGKEVEPEPRRRRSTYDFSFSHQVSEDDVEALKKFAATWNDTPPLFNEDSEEEEFDENSEDSEDDDDF